LWNLSDLDDFMVTPRTKQVETLCNELEYLDAKLKTLGLIVSIDPRRVSRRGSI